MTLLFLLLAPALADPMGDPAQLLWGRVARQGRADALLGAPDRSALSLARALDGLDLPGQDPGLEALARDLEVELRVPRAGVPWDRPAWVLRPAGLISFGDARPPLREGDREPGLASLRLGAEGRLYEGPFAATLAPSLGGDLGPGSLSLRVPDAWVGLQTAAITAGFGRRDRWQGPGRHGSLLLTDNARPAPLGSVAGQGRVPHLGRLRAEAGAGWLDAPRDDVAHPGWLLMDLRWLPVPELELGFGRLSIFGGAGRPPPKIGQLLLPTEPHIYDDPDQLQPDQDELAALDFRARAPLGRWLPGPRLLDYVELWWQYGGEDVIARDVGGLELPSLAGVANLIGGELCRGDLSLTVEYAHILDDTFRWYTGHRVYHAGFTQEGLPMAHPAGGDAVSLWGAATWLPGRRGAQLSLESLRRVGAIGVNGDTPIALAAEERRWSVNVEGWSAASRGGWWRLGLRLERFTGEDFVPGADGWAWRVALSR